MQYLPGTNIPADDISDGFGRLSAAIRTTGGLTRAQLCEMTGLQASTVQNWINRGWVAHPENKRYYEYQTARVVIINMLKNLMSLDDIAALLRYVNGDAECREDDSVPDAELYTKFCRVAEKAKKDGLTTKEAVSGAAEELLCDYTEPFPGAHEKLRNTITVMVLCYISSLILSEAKEILKP